MLNFLKKIFGDKHTKDIKKIQPRVAQINQFYEQYHSLSNDELRHKTVEFQEIIQNHLASINEEIATLKNKAETENLSLFDKDVIYNQVDEKVKERDEQLEVVLDQLLDQAFAVVKQTAKRFTENDTISATATDFDYTIADTREHITIENGQVTFQTKWLAAGSEIDWNMIHYDVQLIGGTTLHQGKVAEMQTGEGKTLTATLPTYLNAIAKQGLHVVTVNDYLARRDSEWMAPIMEFLGLTVDCIDKHRPNSPERKAAYKADVTYGTNNEFGFDYLRDNMVRNSKELVQQKHHFAMIDEVDSVLIDEARTPLIISGPVPKAGEQHYEELKPRIQRLYDEQKKLASQFLIEAKRQIQNGDTNHETGGLALLRSYRALPKSKALIKYLNQQGIRTILQKNENYYMEQQEKNMPLVDQELYFVINEKQNSVDLTEKGIKYLTGADEGSNFFVIPEIGVEVDKIENSNLTDEQKVEAKDKLLLDYTLKAERVHTLQQLLKAYALFENNDDYVVMDGEVKIVDEQTGRIMDGRRYSDGLHQAIEAKEGVKIQDATQTFATVTLQNYFRMYHKLAGMTGTAETEAGELWDIYKLDVTSIPTNRPIQREDKEDKIYKTAKEKYNAVIEEIEELRNQGRPILVGTSSVESSELVSRLLRVRGIPHNVLNAKQHQKESEIVANAGIAGNVTIATNMAGRGTDIKLGPGVKEAGGLAIVATERHDSRRVDRQLRGRSGRQGDPGSSQFFLSLDDKLMRLFGSERISKLMDRMGYEEGEVLQHSMITKSVERAQKKVEENNFGIRKRLLEFDDVMNNQRTVIYKRRKHALQGERLKFDLENSMYDLVAGIVADHKGAQDYESFRLECLRLLNTRVPFDEQTYKAENATTLTEQLYAEFEGTYQLKKAYIIDRIMPILTRLYHERGDEVERVSIPFSDGQRIITTLVNLQEAIDTHGDAIINAFEKTVVLAFIDENWKEHLRAMDELRTSVNMASYEQKDPLLVYKFEAFELFKQMLKLINQETGSFLLRSEPPQIQMQEEMPQEAQEEATDMSEMQTNKEAEESQTDEYKGAHTNTQGTQQRQPMNRRERRAQKKK